MPRDIDQPGMKQTSLQALQGVDLETRLLNDKDRLLEIKNILGDEKPEYPGRHEWAARWLVKKLTSETRPQQEKDSVNLRSAAEAWEFLYDLIKILPAHSLFNIFGNGVFVSILADTLGDNSGNGKCLERTSAQVAVDFNAVTQSLVIPNYEPTEASFASDSSNRRADPIDAASDALRFEDDSFTEKAPLIDAPDLHPERALLELMRDCVYAITRKSDELANAGDTLAAKTTEMLLVAPTDILNRLLSLWMQAAANQMDEFMRLDLGDRKEANRLVGRLQDVLDMTWVMDIWTSGSHEPSVKPENVASFLETCGVNLCKYLALSRLSSHALGQRTPLQDTHEMLEELAVKHVITTARAKFASGTSDDEISKEPLGWLGALCSRCDSDPEGPQNSHVNRLIWIALPVIYELAIRGTPMSGPRQLISETPWLEAVFGELVASAEFLQSYSNKVCGTTIANDLLRMTVYQLLCLANQHKVRFSQTTIQRLAQSYGCRGVTDAELICRPILHQLISMDSAAFADESGLKHVLTRHYFSGLNRSMRIDKSSLRSDTDPPSLFLNVIKEIEMLAQEFVKQRNFSQFIEFWYIILRVDYDREKGNLQSSQTAFEHPSMAVILNKIGESSLSPQHQITIVSENIDRCSTFIKQLARDPWAQDNSGMFASSVIAGMLLHSLEDDKIISDTSSKILDLHCVAKKALHDKQGQPRVRSKIWQLFSVTYRLVVRSNPSMMENPGQIFPSILQLIDQTWLKSESIPLSGQDEEFLSAVAALCECTDAWTLRLRHNEKIELNIAQLLKHIRDMDPLKHDKLGVKLCIVIASHPHVVDSCEASARSAFLKYAIKVAHEHANFLTDKLDFDLPAFWKRAIEAGWERNDQDLKDANQAMDDVIEDTKKDMSFDERLSRLLKETSIYSSIDIRRTSTRTRARYVQQAIECIRSSKKVGDLFLGSLLTTIFNFIQATSDTASPSSYIIGLRSCTNALTSQLDGMDNILSRELYQLWEMVWINLLRFHLSHAPAMKKDAGLTLDDYIPLLTWNEADKAGFRLAKAIAKVFTSSESGEASKYDHIVKASTNRGMSICSQLLHAVQKRNQSHDEPDPVLVAEWLEFLSVFESGVLRDMKNAQSAINKSSDWARDKNAPTALKVFHCIVRLKFLAGPEAKDADVDLLGISIAFGASRRHQQLKEPLVWAICDLIENSPSIAIWALAKRQLKTCNGKDTTVGAWELLGLILELAAKQPDSTDVDCVAGILSLCCSEMRTSRDQFYLSNAFCLMEQVLRDCIKKSIVVSLVDDILCSLTLLASPSGPNVPSSFAPKIYTRACHITQHLLSLHRKKWKGRFHLVLPLLHGLLHCLFSPAVDATHSDKRLQHPPWLDMSSSADGPLTATHAEHYTRLLTTICEPTASSVSVRRKGNTNAALTDETKKMRDYAGRYMDLVLTEFCKMQLIGRLSDGMRKALLPGLFACFNVMNETSIKARMEGLDSGARVVFRSLWDEWKKNGR